jgi:hypothetical protein
MNPEQARQLLGGLAAGILTREERQMLFEAALHDQTIFNEVADEMEFAAFLQSAQTRAQLANRIAVEPKRPQWRLRPAWLAFSGVLAASVVVYLAVPHRPAQVAVEKTSTPMNAAPKLPVAAPAVIKNAAPKPESKPKLSHVAKLVTNAPATEPAPPPSPPQAFMRAAARMAPAAPPPPPAEKPSMSTSLNGSVHDAAGAPIPGATVDILDPSTNATNHMVADSKGRFIASALTPGPYTVTVSAPGFQKEQRSVTLDPAQPAQLDIPLRLGEVTETVSVATAAPPPGLKQVAVLDFVNSGEQNQAGAKVADLVATELKNSGQVGVIDRRKVQAAQNQSKAGQPPSVAQAAAVGRTVGADAVVVGNVQSPGSVTAEVIDTRRAAPVATVAAQAPSLQMAAASLGNQIQSNLARPVEGSVTRRKGNVVTVNFDAPPTFQNGVHGDVFHDGRKIGELVITGIHGQSATGSYHGSGHPRAGDRVRIPSMP